MNPEYIKFLEKNPIFVDEIPINLLCELCKNVMVNSVFLPCGCEFCKKCLENYFNNEDKICPAANENHIDDTKDILNFPRDVVNCAPVNRKVIRLKVKCLDENCSVIKPLDEMYIHCLNYHSEDRNCLFRNLGCNSSVDREQQNAHMIDNITHHNQLLMNTINNIINEQHSIRVRLEPQAAESLHIQVPNEDLEQRLEEVTGERTLHSSEPTTTSPQVPSGASIEELQKQIGALESKVAEMTAKEERLRMELALSCQFIWRIEDYLSVTQLALMDPNYRLESQGFYSHNYGYRLQMFLYPLGDPTCRNKFIVIHIFKVKGPNDYALTFPMKRTIRLTMIDPKTNTEQAFQSMNNNCKGMGCIAKFKIDMQYVNSLLLNNSLALRCLTFPPQ